MEYVILSGRANRPLAEATARELGRPLGDCRVEGFPDGETHVAVECPVAGRRVFVVQPTSPPVAPHLLELVLVADACRRAGAARITGVVPYFGYARQDRRTGPGEPVGARVAADLLATRVDEVVAVDLHEAALEGFLPVMDHRSAVPLLAGALRSRSGDRVVVAPDLGAAKRAQAFARALGLPVAHVHKVRRGGEEVEALEVIGEVEGRLPVVVDDMISTGGTLVSAIEALLDRGCARPVTVAATHGPLTPEAVERLSALPVEEVVVTDSIRHPADTSPLIRVVSLAPLLADAVRGAAPGKADPT